MGTKYDVSVTEASVIDGHFRTSCVCTCGWQGEAEAVREAKALAAASRVRVDHLLEAHPKQAPSSFFRPRAAARYRHPRSLSAAALDGKRYVRHAACACGWTETVRARSPRATGRLARQHHLAHVNLQTGRTPVRDYVVMGVLVVLIGAIIATLAVVAIRESGGDPGDLTSLIG